MNITAFDLNLLPIFEALMDERSVSRAAARVGLSQPAVSNAIRRMREATGEVLFVRTARHPADAARTTTDSSDSRRARARPLRTFRRDGLRAGNGATYFPDRDERLLGVAA